VPANTEAPLLLAVILAISVLALLADLHLSNCIFLLIYAHSGVVAPILYLLNRITLHLAFFLFQSFPIASKFWFPILLFLVVLLHLAPPSVAVFHHYFFQQPSNVLIISSTFLKPQICLQIVRLFFSNFIHFSFSF